MPGCFTLPDRDQFGADVEPDAFIAGAREQGGEGARPASEIGDARAGRQPREPHERVDQPRARLRREYVVVVRGRMSVEERNLFLFVLCWRGHVFDCSHGGTV